MILCWGVEIYSGFFPELELALYRNTFKLINYISKHALIMYCIYTAFIKGVVHFLKKIF